MLLIYARILTVGQGGQGQGHGQYALVGFRRGLYDPPSDLGISTLGRNSAVSGRSAFASRHSQGGASRSSPARGERGGMGRMRGSDRSIAPPSALLLDLGQFLQSLGIGPTGNSPELAPRGPAPAPDPGQHPATPQVRFDMRLIITGLLFPAEPERFFSHHHGGQSVESGECSWAPEF
jgi:hypothetical protein